MSALYGAFYDRILVLDNRSEDVGQYERSGVKKNSGYYDAC